MDHFTTRLQHYVFEARFASRAPVVVRVAKEEGRATTNGGSKLSRMMRPLGVPLPEVIAEDLGGPLSHLVLERLPGPDLGNVVKTLPRYRLVDIATCIARAQTVAAARRLPDNTSMLWRRPMLRIKGGRKFWKALSPDRERGSSAPATFLLALSTLCRGCSQTRASSTPSRPFLSFTIRRPKMLS